MSEERVGPVPETRSWFPTFKADTSCTNPKGLREGSATRG